MCDTTPCLAGHCGQCGTERDCAGFLPRERPCLLESCDNTFSSDCGLQLFCSEECLVKSGLLPLIKEAVRDVKRTPSKKTLTRRRADSRYKKTPQGKEKRREQRRRYYLRCKERKAQGANKEPTEFSVSLND